MVREKVIENFLTAFIIYFVVIDPIGNAPIFLSVTAQLSKIQKYRVAVEASVIATLIMIFFGVCGAWILQYLQISISAFKISGGIILFLVALDMLTNKRHDRKKQDLNELGASDANDNVAVYPLAIPLLAGPAAITSVMVISADLAGDTSQAMIGYAALVTVMASTSIIFVLTGLAQGYINHKITSVFSRITAIILASLSIQYLIDGLEALGIVKVLS